MEELIVLFARGGGGGSGGGGGAVGILVLPFIIASAIGAWWYRRQKIKKAKKDLEVALVSDPVWGKTVDRATQVFEMFQEDWSHFNVANMKNYLEPKYFEHISLMMEALQQMNRQNMMSDVRLHSATMYNVSDNEVNTHDKFDIEITASAHDELIDTKEQKSLFVDTSKFTEIWHFDRKGKQWNLEKIYQTGTTTPIEEGYFSADQVIETEDEAVKMQVFAYNNNFFYNADFGWLLLPTRGQLFTLANFGRSDINYHVIGKYHDVLVQFYQYMPVVEDKRTTIDYFKAFYSPANRYDAYIVAQTILPKTYGNIIVKRKGVAGSYGLSLKPKGMTKISLEGVDFDKNFNVYATDIEKATSLELLHPKYMETLLSVPFEVNIEIVDDVLYLYSTDKSADFDTMLTLLKDAFDEMKM